MNYLESNKQAYEATAHEFEQKIELRRPSDEVLVPALCEYFEDTFSPAHILELGPGSGYIAKLLTERNHDVAAVEFSPKMAAVAQRTAPNAEVIIDDFLTHDFGSTQFDVVLGIAFIHLFKEKDAKKVMSKISDLLVDQGIIILSTTLHDEVREGHAEKTNFQAQPIRFRRYYTEHALTELATGSGFTVLDTSINADSEGITDKRWLNLVARKTE